VAGGRGLTVTGASGFGWRGCNPVFFMLYPFSVFYFAFFYFAFFYFAFFYFAFFYFAFFYIFYLYFLFLNGYNVYFGFFRFFCPHASAGRDFF
jgi:hypothetical protein